MYKKIILEDGLRFISAPIASSHTVTVLVMVGVGSRYESKRLNGMSHFLEHMFFKGTKKRNSAMAVSTELDKIGANYNAFTGKEATGFYIKTDSRHIDLSIDVISDILTNSNFDIKEVDKERGVILEEMKMVKDTPMHYVCDLFEQLLYGEGPLGQLIVGEEENISKFDRNDFVSYMKKFYTTKSVVICVAGDESKIKGVQAKIQKAFQGVKKAKLNNKALDSAIPEQKKPEVLLHSKKTDQAHVCIGVRAYGLKDKNRYALKLLGVILGGNMSSRLFNEVREKRGLAYYVHTDYDAYVDEGYLVTQSGLHKTKVEDGLKVILKEYKKIADEGVGEEELSKAKEYIKGISAISLETSDRIASFLANQEVLLEEIVTLEENFKKIDKVTTKDIQNIAKDIFVNEKLNLAIIGDYKNKKQFVDILKF